MAPKATVHRVMIEVDAFEVDITTREATWSGPAESKVVRPSDEQIAAACVRVLDKYADEVEALVIAQIEGRVMA